MLHCLAHVSKTARRGAPGTRLNYALDNPDIDITSMLGRAGAGVIIRAVMPPSSNILNGATVNRDDPMSVFPNLKFDVHQSPAVLAKVRTEVLATLHLEAMRICDKAKSDVFVGFRIKAGFVLILGALPSHRLRDVLRSLATSCK